MDRRFLLRSHAAEVLPFASSDDEPTSSSDWDPEFDTSPSTPASSLSGPAAPPSSTLSSSSLGSAPWDEPAGGRAAVCQSRDVSSRLKGSATAQVDVEATYRISPRVLFDLLSNPQQHDKIFDAIERADSELLSEVGPVRTYRLDYLARWKFWKVSGTCTNKLIMTTDSQRGTVEFKLREPGFLRNYEGCWTITDAATGALNPLSAPAPASPQPAIASLSLGGRGGAAGAAPSHLAKPKQGVVSAIAHMLDQQELARLAAQRAEYSQHGEPRQRQHQLAMIRAQCFTTPSRTPPPPINQALKSQARAQIEDQLDGLVRAAEKLQG
ncbi:hypothetical protein MNEG_7685 [Monoraphidium neglectum]|uniref:Coenzyme Q-binding protein COQ10 START domain-containing protein n=1 Tax=Monoraphidium neglectum TaxID=145388 RepID=A0A0D2JM47_9CHLO|nr:hypothetical protein MNEG_7685 [Monoraphidium neglectum]KIZ00278.1 hypothetical protein MNEG_7685 [Monoraphidium neglectum]|eukprot:XP_013899297.1 hypothetical protein MNEG_7685 [Monoraphidium neglectum]